MTQESSGGFYESSWLGTQWLQLVSQIVHVFTAVTLIGVPFVVRYVVIPQADDATTASVVEGFYSVWPLIVAVVLFSTGFLNFLFANSGSGNSFIGSFLTPFGIMVLVKMSLLVVIDVISIMLGINEDFQADADMWLLVLMTLGIVALILGSTMHRGGVRLEKS
jgi:putative copper export protein